MWVPSFNRTFLFYHHISTISCGPIIPWHAVCHGLISISQVTWKSGASSVRLFLAVYVYISILPGPYEEGG
jgi:hypothetical protein